MDRKILFIMLLPLVMFNYSFCQNNSDTISYKRLTKFVLATVNYTAYSTSEYRKDDEVSQIRMEEYNAKFQFFLKLKKKKLYLINKFSSNRFEVYADKGGGMFQNFNPSYISFSYGVGLIQILKNRWKIVGVLSPTLASDFNNEISRHDFLIQYSILVSKRANVEFEYGFGVTHNTRFGRPLIIPLLSYTYLKGNWIHNGVFPAYMASYYSINQFDFGVKLSSFGNVYNSNNATVSNLELDKLGYSRINIGPDFKFHIYKSLYANISTGITLRNRLFSINSNGGLEMELPTHSKYFLNLGLNILK